MSLDPRDPLPPSPLTDWEVTSIAVRMVQRAECDQFIAERVQLLALLDDVDGVATWRAVEAKVEAIRNAPSV